MQQRLPVVLSATALAVALLGSTPLGEAARDLASSVPPFAKKAGYANQAGFAKNAGAVAGIKAARTPKPGLLVPLGADGKFPAAVGLAGPPGEAGPKGDAGAPGSPGLSELEYVLATALYSSDSGVKSVTASCPSGKKVVGGGARLRNSPDETHISLSLPTGDLSGWDAQATKPLPSGLVWSVSAVAVCAKVAA